jgi:hypothetical protein
VREVIQEHRQRLAESTEPWTRLEVPELDPI